MEISKTSLARCQFIKYDVEKITSEEFEKLSSKLEEELGELLDFEENRKKEIYAELEKLESQKHGYYEIDMSFLKTRDGAGLPQYLIFNSYTNHCGISINIKEGVITRKYSWNLGKEGPYNSDFNDYFLDLDRFARMSEQRRQKFIGYSPDLAEPINWNISVNFEGTIAKETRNLIRNNPGCFIIKASKETDEPLIVIKSGDKFYCLNPLYTKEEAEETIASYNKYQEEKIAYEKRKDDVLFRRAKRLRDRKIKKDAEERKKRLAEIRQKEEEERQLAAEDFIELTPSSSEERTEKRSWNIEVPKSVRDMNTFNPYQESLKRAEENLERVWKDSNRPKPPEPRNKFDYEKMDKLFQEEQARKNKIKNIGSAITKPLSKWFKKAKDIVSDIEIEFSDGNASGSDISSFDDD